MRPWLRVNRSTSRAVSRQGRRWITYAGSCCTAPFEATMAASEVAHAQTFQGPVAVCPAPLDLDPQPQHHLAAEHLLHIHAGILANLAQALALITDDDLPLTFTLDQDQGRNMQDFALMLELFNFDRHGIPQLCARSPRQPLTHQFRSHEALAAIRQLVMWVEMHTLRQIPARRFCKLFPVGLFQGRQPSNLHEFPLLRQRIQAW